MANKALFREANEKLRAQQARPEAKRQQQLGPGSPGFPSLNITLHDEQGVGAGAGASPPDTPRTPRDIPGATGYSLSSREDSATSNSSVDMSARGRRLFHSPFGSPHDDPSLSITVNDSFVATPSGTPQPHRRSHSVPEAESPLPRGERKEQKRGASEPRSPSAASRYGVELPADVLEQSRQALLAESKIAEFWLTGLNPSLFTRLKDALARGDAPLTRLLMGPNTAGIDAKLAQDQFHATNELMLAEGRLHVVRTAKAFLQLFIERERDGWVADWAVEQMNRAKLEQQTYEQGRDQNQRYLDTYEQKARERYQKMQAGLAGAGPAISIPSAAAPGLAEAKVDSDEFKAFLEGDIGYKNRFGNLQFNKSQIWRCKAEVERYQRLSEECGRLEGIRGSHSGIYAYEQEAAAYRRDTAAFRDKVPVKPVTWTKAEMPTVRRQLDAWMEQEIAARAHIYQAHLDAFVRRYVAESVADELPQSLRDESAYAEAFQAKYNDVGIPYRDVMVEKYRESLAKVFTDVTKPFAENRDISSMLQQVAQQEAVLEAEVRALREKTVQLDATATRAKEKQQGEYKQATIKYVTDHQDERNASGMDGHFLHGVLEHDLRLPRSGLSQAELWRVIEREAEFSEGKAEATVWGEKVVAFMARHNSLLLSKIADENGNTLLHHELMRYAKLTVDKEKKGCLANIALLCAHGADMFKRNHRGQTAWEAAGIELTWDLCLIMLSSISVYSRFALEIKDALAPHCSRVKKFLELPVFGQIYAAWNRGTLGQDLASLRLVMTAYGIDKQTLQDEFLMATIGAFTTAVGTGQRIRAGVDKAIAVPYHRALTGDAVAVTGVQSRILEERVKRLERQTEESQRGLEQKEKEIEARILAALMSKIRPQPSPIPPTAGAPRTPVPASPSVPRTPVPAASLNVPGASMGLVSPGVLGVPASPGGVPRTPIPASPGVLRTPGAPFSPGAPRTPGVPASPGVLVSPGVEPGAAASRPRGLSHAPVTREDVAGMNAFGAAANFGERPVAAAAAVGAAAVELEVVVAGAGQAGQTPTKAL